jgi:hypothetical protein
METPAEQAGVKAMGGLSLHSPVCPPAARLLIEQNLDDEANYEEKKNEE